MSLKALECKTTQIGKEYVGITNVTPSERDCQRWDSQNPHEHSRNNIDDFPETQLEDAANFCRNPDDTAGGPWCYTTDPNKRWEFCDIPFCGMSYIHNTCLPYIPPYVHILANLLKSERFLNKK